MSQRIGFAGLGLMGSRMARNLLKKGFETTVWNRTRERAETLAAEGARVAASPRELAERADVVVACVADPRAVERLVFADDGLLGGVRPGFRYLECSTVSPETTRRVQAALRERGRRRAGGARDGLEERGGAGDAAVHDRRRARGPRRAVAADDGDGHEGDLLRHDGRRARP